MPTSTPRTWCGDRETRLRDHPERRRAIPPASGRGLRHHVSSGPGRRRSHAESPRDRGGAREARVQRCVPGLEHAAAAVRQSGRPPGDGYGHRYRWAVGGGLPRRGDRRKESDPIRDATPRGGSRRPRVRAAGCPSVSAVGGVVACNAAGARRWSVPSRTGFKWTSTPLVGRRRAAPMGPSTGCVLLSAVGVVRRLGHKGVDLELLLAVVRVWHVQLFPVPRNQPRTARAASRQLRDHSQVPCAPRARPSGCGCCCTMIPDKGTHPLRPSSY